MNIFLICYSNGKPTEKAYSSRSAAELFLSHNSNDGKRLKLKVVELLNPPRILNMAAPRRLQDYGECHLCRLPRGKVYGNFGAHHSGFVYILRRNSDGYYKIGRSLRGGISRAKSLSHKLEPITFVTEFSVKCMQYSESHLHAAFRSKRVSGEWFRLKDSDIERIKSLMLQGRVL